jgi:hypothetical protein
VRAELAAKGIHREQTQEALKASLLGGLVD